MGKLADIASFAVKKTGIFHNTQTKQISGSTMPTGSKIVVLHICLLVKYFICVHIFPTINMEFQVVVHLALKTYKV